LKALSSQISQKLLESCLLLCLRIFTATLCRMFGWRRSETTFSLPNGTSPALLKILLPPITLSGEAYLCISLSKWHYSGTSFMADDRFVVIMHLANFSIVHCVVHPAKVLQRPIPCQCYQECYASLCCTPNNHKLDSCTPKNHRLDRTS
jgi:hypothetical protein